MLRRRGKRRRMNPLTWIFALGALALGLYRLLNVFAPSLTIRWQRASTERSQRRSSEGLGTSVGHGFASVVAAEGPEPWRDPTVQRRVRWIGVAELVVALAFGVGAWMLTG